jgi:hypothetical protein
MPEKVIFFDGKAAKKSPQKKAKENPAKLRDLRKLNYSKKLSATLISKPATFAFSNAVFNFSEI